MFFEFAGACEGAEGFCWLGLLTDGENVFSLQHLLRQEHVPVIVRTRCHHRGMYLRGLAVIGVSCRFQ